MTILQEKYNKNQNAILEQQKQRLYQRWKNSGLIADDSVLDAFLEVPRELFVDPSGLDQSYADHALPIGSGQTISQPTTVILMLQLLDVLPGHRVLEIGTGSGYNAALLAKLVKPAGMVVTMERHGKLVEEAGQNLLNAGLEEVVVISGDGKLGYAEMAPYDGIIVTAAADQVPQILKDQLVIGGRLVAPVGATYGCEMLKLNKTSPDHFETSSHGLFSFVPLIWKIIKTYGNNTGLLIVFNDYMAISNKKRVDDVFALKEVLNKFIKEHTPFCWIVIIWWSGRIFVECKVER